MSISLQFSLASVARLQERINRLGDVNRKELLLSLIHI